MKRFILLLIVITFALVSRAQLAEVRVSYNITGDVSFSAYNNTVAPLYLLLDFADLENAVLNVSLPYIQLLDPGFNSLFTLYRQSESGVPQFHYNIRTYRSDPLAIPDLDFPYLIPFEQGEEVAVSYVKSLEGFMGTKDPVSWNATGFAVTPRQQVYASRTGIVVEVAGAQRTGDPITWYHTWNNSITLLQPDGTLICYRNVTDPDRKLKPGTKVIAGQPLGVVAPDARNLILVIYQHRQDSDVMNYVIPQFITGENEAGVLISSKMYKVIHPAEIRGRELTRKEKRQYLR